VTDLLFRSVLLPDGRTTDLAVRDGRLIDPADVSAPRVVDVAGSRVLPGLVDLHTHLREPGGEAAETIASGTAAAARGGYTAVFAMANTTPVADSPAAIADVAERALGASAEVVPIGAVTRELGGSQIAPLEEMHALGVTVYSDDGHCVANTDVMREVFERIRCFGGVVAQHSQDPVLAPAAACCHDPSVALDYGLVEWPPTAESVIVARDVQLAQETGARLHVCHVSSAESVEIIRWAKQRGVAVTAEATPHHLLLGSGEVPASAPDRASGPDPLYKVNPPLTDNEHIAALRQGVADGTIDVIATDHAPHPADAKRRPFATAKPGMLGLEQSLAVVIATLVEPGLLDWVGVADRMSLAPARIGSIPDRQGRPLTVGEPATFVLIDPTRRGVVPTTGRSIAHNNPYAHRELPDPVLATLWNGRVTWADPALGLVPA
jgi:dihydroorotase